MKTATKNRPPATAPIGFRISIVLNLALLAVVVVLWRRDRLGRSEDVAAIAATARTPSESQPAQAPPTTMKPSEPTRLTSKAVAQLEQQGVAHDFLVHVAVDDFNRRWDARVTELQQKYAPKDVPQKELNELTRMREAAQESELKAELGEAGYRQWDKEQKLRELNSANPAGVPMSPEEADKAYALQKAFDAKNEELQQAAQDGVADKADVGTLQAQAQQAFDQQLKSLLGQERFDELRGNGDPAAAVYQQYSDLKPTADQANAVLRADAAYRDQEAALAKQLAANPADANVTAELQALDDAHDASLRQIFGAGAYDQSKLQNDPTYQTLTQYAGAWNLNDNQVQSAYQALRAFQDQADRMRTAADLSQSAGQKVNWRQVDAAIEQARQQAEAGLANQLGGETVWRLEQNGFLAKPH